MRNPSLLCVSPKNALNFTSVKIAEINRLDVKKLTNITNILFCRGLINAFAFIIKNPSNQLPLMVSIQNFGELKGSSRDGLKYKVTAEAKNSIVVNDILLTGFLFAIFPMDLSYLIVQAQPRF